MSTYIDIEIIHTLPFANANKDDLGQPKTVRFGGTVRGRLSSQSLKRAARFYGVDATNFYNFKNDSTGNLFYRTKYLKHLIQTEIESRGIELTDEVKTKIEKILKDNSLGKEHSKDKSLSDTLLLLTADEIKELTTLVLEDKLNKDNITSVLTKSDKKDIALWGRFFASNPEATLEGSAQVAHAITTHPVTVEEDFFSAVDDAINLYSANSGSGFVDSAYYNTGTFYKYLNFNIEETVATLLNIRAQKTNLLTNGKSEDQVQAEIGQITKDAITNFALSNPQGKIRSSAHQTLPSLVRVTIRQDRPVNGVVAYEKAITNKENSESITEASIEKLAQEQAKINQFVQKPLFSEYVISLDTTYSELGTKVDTISSLIEDVQKTVEPLVHDFLLSLGE